MGSEVNNNGGGGGSSSSSIEVSSWLKGLAVAPEYHPTLAEFQDPIAYIFKIEKEASRYGICKIVPPVSSAPRKTVVSNLNRSLSARPGSGSNSSAPTFTTRQQQIGFCARKHHCPVQKPVWQSGESYTVQEFEAKAKGFEKAYLKKFARKPLNALEIETLFWKATLDKPFSVEYANDMPGSAFSVKKDRGEEGKNNNSANNCNVTVGETEWNMRGVSRAKGSLLRFMKEEIPGVTSPMVYIAMMFSWFAWHVEDHDLHSLNYLHTGAGKTWYGVPRDAAVAFEDVIRDHGYGGEINPLVTFATLGEKTTVMSPEVLVNAGVPCCRLVQNPGEFVVTFPRAYHSGFSHGFNCGEAANIATPEWLTVAKDAAIRRASINYPPMVSHFQLLYDLALSLCSRVPKNICTEPRSSRLKDKKKDEGEIIVKDLFLQDVLQNNNLLHILGKGSSVVILPRISLSKSICSNLQGGFQSKVKARLFTSLCSPDLEVKTRKSLVSDDIMLDGNQGSKHVTGSHAKSIDTGSDGDQCDRVTSQGLFSCITCGILCFASVAMIQPTETASQYLMSGDCSIFSDWEGNADRFAVCSKDTAAPGSISSAGLMLKRTTDGLVDVPIESAGQIQSLDDDTEVVISNTEAHKDTSSLGLLALNYGNCSDSEDDIHEADIPVEACETKSRSSLPENGYDSDNTGSAFHGTSNCHDPPCPKDNRVDKISLEIDDSYAEHELTKAKFKGESEGSFDYSRPKLGLQSVASNCSLGVNKAETTISTTSAVTESTKKPFAPRSDEDSSRMHIFCLQHAVQVEKQLRSIGGAHVVLLCHPDYPELEAQAKKVAKELGSDHLWSDISYREATKEDEGMIQLTLDGEEAIHGNGDWAVKLGINLYYSANLSRSPLYSKQMPYNRVIYNAFGCRSTANNENNSQANGKWSGRHKKLVVAGKWCGKVWMSTQVHPLLAEQESEEQEQERSIPGPVKGDLKLQKPSEGTKTAEAVSTTCKVGRKRKTSAETRSVIKAESPEAEDSEPDFEVLPISGKQHKNNLRNKRMKKETPEPQMKSVRNGKQLEAEDPEDDFEVLAISGKEHKNNLRSKRMKKETPEPQMKSVRNGKQLEAEDSEDGFEVQPISGKQHKKNLRNKQKKKETPGPKMKSVRNGKQLEAEDSEDNFEVLPISGKQHKSNLRNKRMKKDTPEPQLKSVRNGKQLEAEDSEEDFEVLISGKQHKNNLRNKRMKKETPEPQLKSARNGRQLDSHDEDELEGGPSTRLRKRIAKPSKESVKKVEVKLSSKKQNKSSKAKKGPAVKAAVRSNSTKIKEEAEFQCDTEGCSMSFGSKQELVLHKKNICPVKGCGKKFFSHKYLVQHRRVHMDERPLKCPWKGCKMTFKWAWARTEHIRVHTGARPYVCAEPGCGQTFRFVSDFSRHKRKTGHISKKVKR